MREIFYGDGSGRVIPVAHMPTAEIHESLASGFWTVECMPNEVTERLKLELEIRALGLGEME